ncbi:hypothetical protein EAH79_04080 [Sphingomonas koreensis]|nr:hypothetical protein EAH79_04080 [Sphingomonas koreensis]
MPFIALFASLLVAGQLAPPPPVADGPLPPGAFERHRFVTFEPGAVDCAGIAVTATREEAPMASVGFAYGSNQMSPARGFYRIHFSIDGDGRPIDIDHEGQDAVPGWIDASDVMPAFAAWRFAAAAPQTRCTIAFTIHDQPVSAVPPAEAMRYFALPHVKRGDERDIFERTPPPGSTCFTPYAPAELVRVWPDFETIPQAPGTRSFTTIEYDIDARGKPIHVRVVASDGNRDLEAKGVASIKRSRFAKGARSGCTYPFRRTPIEPLQAPEGPKAGALRPADADCEGAGDWTHLGLLSFPEPFGKRSIEGWAIVRFDVAPWGETGDIKVLAAEPADVFGTQAIQTIRQSTKPVSKRGYTGCVQRVNFKMGKPGEPGKTID